jgi:all-trans-retinol dehydrogenase (NAD+)
MVEQNHGHFVIIASHTGHVTISGLVDYSATKAAAISIFEGLQTEVKHVYKAPGVRISCIAPSAVDTKMFTGFGGSWKIFLPRLKPQDVAEVVSQTLRQGNARNLMMPPLAYLSVATRLMPDWLRIRLQDIAADYMRNVTPHNPFD